jgi:FkbM family methyltransferase
LITRRYPFLSGYGTFANSRLVRAAAGAQGGLVWCRLRCGTEILVPLSDYIGKAVFFLGDLDRKISEVIRRIVRPGDRVLDVGANLGVVTLQLARLVGPNGVVHSFEPNPAVHRLLEQSLERNHLTNVRLHKCALGADDGTTLTLNFSEENAGLGTVCRGSTGAGWSSVEVPVRTLSALAAEHDFGEMRLMKMDVEGFELTVLRGALAWLAARPPEAIVFESNEGRDPKEPDPVISFLSEQGYTFYSIPKRLFSLKLVPYRLGSEHAEASHDMLAIRKDREQEIVSKFVIGS